MDSGPAGASLAFGLRACKTYVHLVHDRNRGYFGFAKSATLLEEYVSEKQSLNRSRMNIVWEISELV